MLATEDKQDIENRLAQFIAAETGADVVVELQKPIAGGASRDTWLLTASIDENEQQLVLRRDLDTEIFEHTLDREQEYALLQFAYENDVKVPRPRFVCMNNEVLGRPFFLMDYVDGVSIGPKVVHAPRLKPLHAYLPGLLGTQLAGIHSIPFDNPRLAFLSRPNDDRSAAEQALFEARQTVERLQISNPAIELGMRWLEQNAPPDQDRTLIHGDYRIGNFIVGERGLHAIIDWEFSHIGDPHEDLAWPCVRDWRFGNGHLHFGGVSDREPFILAYEEASGRTIDRAVLDYWEIVGNVRWAITCLSQANRHLSGFDPSVEFASLGRRSVEMQYELLRLIQAKG
jgi:aminoglycoside phosphotransferase (APT) family kinase protein